MVMALEDAIQVQYRVIHAYELLMESYSQFTELNDGPEHPPAHYLEGRIVQEDVVGDILRSYGLCVADIPGVDVETYTTLATAFTGGFSNFRPLPWYLTSDVRGRSGEEAEAGRGMTPINFVSFLIMLERMGLPIDAKPWVDAILPTLQTELLVVGDERAIVAYEGERNNVFVNLKATLPAEIDPYSRSWSVRNLNIHVLAGLVNHPDTVQLLIEPKQHT